MTSIKNFFRSVWAIWVVIAYLLTVLVCWVIFIFTVYIDTPLTNRITIWVGYRIVSPVTFFLAGIRVKKHNTQVIDKKQPYVIVSNHNSSLDIMANLMSYPTLYKFLSKKEVGSIPLAGPPMKKMMVAVDRKDRESRASSFGKMKAVLEKEKMSILLYPEGTRNKTNKLLQNFKTGAFRLAIETQKPLLICTLVGGRKVQSATRKIDLAPGTIHAFWEEPISTVGLTMDDVDELAARTKAIMTKRLEENIHLHQD